MERLAEILEKINKEQQVPLLFDWLQKENPTAAKDFKKIISKKSIQPIFVYKLKKPTRNILADAPLVRYYDADKASWINNYKG